MELVGARLSDEGHDAAPRVTVFGFKAVGVDSEFGERFYGGRVRGYPAFLQRARSRNRDSIEGGSVTCPLTAAEGEAGIAANVLRFGRERGQIERTAHRASNDQRQRVNQFLTDGDARF